MRTSFPCCFALEIKITLELPSLFHEGLDLRSPSSKGETHSKDQRSQSPPKSTSFEKASSPEESDFHDGDDLEHNNEGEQHDWLEGHSSIKFLIAGGIAGAGKWRVSNA